MVWIDENADGIQDAGEPGISGVTVTLTDLDGNVTDHGQVTLVRGEVATGFVEIFPVPATTEINVTFTSAVDAQSKVDV